jgi:hypothetical protein
MDTRVAALTVRLVVPDTPLEVAVRVAEPAAIAVASPVVATVATLVDDELQVTDVVRFFVDPSLYVPVAVSCEVNPAATLELAAVTAMDERVGAGAAPLPPPPHAATNAVRPSNSAAAIDLNPGIDLGEKRTGKLRIMRHFQGDRDC